MHRKDYRHSERQKSPLMPWAASATSWSSIWTSELEWTTLLTRRDQPGVQQIITYQIGETETQPADQHWSLPPIVKISRAPRLLLDLKESKTSTSTAGHNQLTALIAGKSSVLDPSTSLDSRYKGGVHYIFLGKSLLPPSFLNSNEG